MAGGDASEGADASSPTSFFYHGESNRKRRVALTFGEHLSIAENGVDIASWSYSDIRRVDGGTFLRLKNISGPPLARLDVQDESTADRLRALCPLLEQEIRDVSTFRIVGWSLAAAASIALMIFYGIPFAADRLAPVVPASFETRLGQAVDPQVQMLTGGTVCNGAEGQAALAALVAKLDIPGSGLPVDAKVLSIDAVNAITLPGGKIYIFDGLLQKAEDPDEVAGILAHEIGHVRHRDSLRAMIQTGGTSFLFGLLFGDVTGSGVVIFVSRSLLDASHSRETEMAADDFAVDAMARLGRSAVPMGEFLLRVTGAGEIGTLLDSHPMSAKRLERIKESDRRVTGPALLSDREWSALKNVCSDAH